MRIHLPVIQPYTLISNIRYIFIYIYIYIYVPHAIMMLRFNVWHNSITAYKQLNYDLCPFLIFLNTLIRMSNKISSKRKQVIKKGFKTWACNTKIQFVKTYKTKSMNLSLYNRGLIKIFVFCCTLKPKINEFLQVC